MLNTWKALLASRKFWVGTITVAAVIGAVVLVALGKIPSSALVPTITAMTAAGLGVIGSIAWEDAAQKSVTGKGGPSGASSSKDAAPPPAP